MSDEQDQQPPDAEETAAPEPVITVNGEGIFQKDIDFEVAKLRDRYSRNMLPEEFAEREPQIENDAKENAIERLILLQEAKKRFAKAPKSEVTARFNKMKREAGGPQAFYQRYGLTPEADEQIRADIAIDVRYDMYLDTITAEVPAPDDDTCQVFYEQNESSFTEPEQVKASHILLRQGAGMDTATIYTRLLNLKKQLEAGTDFNMVAAQLGGQSGDSGDLGWFARGQMVPAFEETAFAMQPGEISDVVATDFGFHLLKVFERKPERLRGFDEVKKQIRDVIWNDHKNRAIGAMVDALKQEAEITGYVFSIDPEIPSSAPEASRSAPEPPAEDPGAEH